MSYEDEYITWEWVAFEHLRNKQAKTYETFISARGPDNRSAHIATLTGRPGPRARLIAAAPDLLREIKALRDQYTRLANLSDLTAHDWNGMYDVDAAIEKAEGRAS